MICAIAAKLIGVDVQQIRPKVLKFPFHGNGKLVLMQSTRCPLEKVIKRDENFSTNQYDDQPF